MKTTFLKILKLFAIYVVFLHFGCSKDFYDEQITKSSRSYVINHVPIRELFEENKFSKAYDKISKIHPFSQQLSTSRTAFENEYGFTIVDIPANVIEFDGKTTYTLKIVKDSTQTNELDNLLIVSDALNESKSYLINYKLLPTTNEQATKAIDISEPIKKYEIAFDPNVSVSSKFSADCVTTVIIFCRDERYYCGGTDQGCSRFSIISCGGGSGEISSSSNGGSGGEIITTPVGTNPHGGGGGGGYDLTPPNPCENLKKHLSVNTGIKLKSPEIYDYLKDKLDQPNEYGFYFKKENNVYTPYQSYNATTDKITIKVGENYFCSIHTHPYPAANPMFSWEDIFTLQQYFQNCPSGLTEEVTIFLVVKDNYGENQLYALKIDDFSSFSDFIIDDIANTITPQDLTGLTTDADISRKTLDIMNAKQHKYNKENPNMNQEVPFLTYFAGCGASLYKSNSALTNWDKLTLSNNTANPITKIPCN